MKLAKLEFGHIAYEDGRDPAVVCTTYDKEGNEIFKHAGAYVTDDAQGAANVLEFIAKCMRGQIEGMPERYTAWFKNQAS